MIHQNSRNHYIEMLSSGRLNRQQKKVFDYIWNHTGLTRNEISRGLNLPMGSVCPRVTELKKKNLIYEKFMKNRRTVLFVWEGSQTVSPVESGTWKSVSRLVKKLKSMIDKFPSLKMTVIQELQS